MITASLVQIAVPLDSAMSAQLVLEATCPGVFDVTSPDRTVWAYTVAPTVPAVCVAQGRVEQVQYAALGALALGASINHLAVGSWIDQNPVVQPAQPGGTLWEAMAIQPVEEPPL